MKDRKPEGDPTGCIFAWFAMCAIAALSVVGVVIWAVIKLVNHFTG